MPAQRPSKKVAPNRKTIKAAATAPMTTSTFSPRLVAIHADLDCEIRRLFPQAEARRDYSMKGWRIARSTHIKTWEGTIDPNFLHIYIAERKNGITLHFWNPFDPYHLKRHSKELEGAGFKVMVGCLQFTRKGDYPVRAVVPLLESARRAMDREA